MSFEGHYEGICKNGHSVVWDAYDDGESCSLCGAPMGWTNLVDDTNCEATGEMPDAFWHELQETTATVETCNLGHQHVTPGLFRLPTPDILEKYKEYKR